MFFLLVLISMAAAQTNATSNIQDQKPNHDSDLQLDHHEMKQTENVEMLGAKIFQMSLKEIIVGSMMYLWSLVIIVSIV